jgi:fermentation-respiration switch protein FrsA (DUF1100 family)
MMARLVVPAAILIAVAVAVLALVWIFQRRLMYFPDARVLSPANVGIPRAEEVTFATGDGLQLAGWFVPAIEATRSTILVFNGNAGNRSYRAPLAHALGACGFNVFLFDYRGFGGNPGSASEAGLAADARAARAYLAGRADVDTSRLVYFGESLGTGVAVTLAVEQPPAALVLRSPLTSMADVGAYHYPVLPVRLLLRDRFASNEAIGHLRSPLLIIAGDRDEIVPLDHSRRLYEAAPGPKELLIIYGASHNDDSLLDGAEMIAGIVRFLRQHVRGSG